MTIDVKKDALTGKTLKFTVGGEKLINAAVMNSFDYEDAKGSKVESQGSITISDVKVQTSKGSFINDLSRAVEFKLNKTNSTPALVFDGTYTAKKGMVKINEIVVSKVDGTTDLYDSDITLKIEIAGDDVASFSLNAQTTGDSKDIKVIKVENKANVPVKAYATVYAGQTGSNDIRFNIEINGEDENGNPVNSTSAETVTMKYVGSQAVTVATNAAMKAKDIILADKNQEVAKFYVSPEKEGTTATIDEIVFAISGFGTTATDDIDSIFQIKLGNDVLDNIAFSGDNTIVAKDVNTTINGDTTVTLVYKKQLTGGNEYNMTGSVNGYGKKEFSRQATNAIVRVNSQKVTDTDTKYIFGIEFADSYNGSKTISDIVMT